MNHSHQKSRFKSYSESQPQLAPHTPVIAHNGTWLELSAMDESFRWALPRPKIRLKGSPQLLLAFGRCFPSLKGEEQ